MILTSWCTHRCRLEWRFNQQKEYFGWNTQDSLSNVDRVREGSEFQMLPSGGSEHDALRWRRQQRRCTPTTSGILGNAGEAPIENWFDSGSRHDPEARIRTAQIHWDKTTVVPSETRGEIHESIADGDVFGMAESSQYGTRQWWWCWDEQARSTRRDRTVARVEALHAVPRSELIATWGSKSSRDDIDGTIGIGWARLEQATRPVMADGCRVRFVNSFCSMLWHRSTQHKQCRPLERVDVVHAQTPCGLCVDYS